MKKIEPAFGEAAKQGIIAAEVPEECPTASDVPDSKLLEAMIQGQGLQPVVVELRDDLFPALRPCSNGSECDDFFASGWERTIVARRMLTCLSTWIETQLQGPALEVSYLVVDGIPLGPKLPPFGDSIRAVKAFGLGLTWDEAKAAAMHPYVERIWTSPGLSFDVLPEGCPPDYDVPVKTPECSVASESIDGKLTEASKQLWQASAGPHEVLIAVRREQSLCPLPACPGRAADCPERDRYLARVKEETVASQTCVRALIASSGGMASDEVLILGNAISATLTWEQIQIVAAHPDVVSVSPGIDGSPPP